MERGFGTSTTGSKSTPGTTLSLYFQRFTSFSCVTHGAGTLALVDGRPVFDGLGVSYKNSYKVRHPLCFQQVSLDYRSKRGDFSQRLTQIEEIVNRLGGRPISFSASERHDICTEIGVLIVEGASLKTAYERISQRRGVKPRTIQRTWNQREKKAN